MRRLCWGCGRMVMMMMRKRRRDEAMLAMRWRFDAVLLSGALAYLCSDRISVPLIICTANILHVSVLSFVTFFCSFYFGVPVTYLTIPYPRN